MKRFPTWKDRFPKQLKNLFVNWHPALLGHEVMGNQLAYYYSGIFLRGIDILVDAEEKVRKQIKEARGHRAWHSGLKSWNILGR